MVLANALRRRRPTGGLHYTLERRLRQRGRGTMASSAKRIPDRADEERAYGIRIAKPELGLGWVHVHVHLFGRHGQEQSQHRITAVWHEVAVGRARGAYQR